MSDTEEDIIKSYYRLKPSQYGYLKTFKLYRNIHRGGCSDYFLELQMCSSSDLYENKRLHLFFSGIKELKIGSVEGLLNFLIDISSIQEYQLEDIKFRVVESEYNAFSFLCSNIKAMIK